MAGPAIKVQTVEMLKDGRWVTVTLAEAAAAVRKRIKPK